MRSATALKRRETQARVTSVEDGSSLKMAERVSFGKAIVQKSEKRTSF